MLYPIISYEDGTEVTASKPNSDGQITIYTEKFDEKSDMFFFAAITVPNPTIVSSNGYSKDELNSMLKEYAEIQDDVIEYVLEKERISA